MMKLMNVIRGVLYLIKHYPVYVLGYFVNELMIALPNYVGNVLFLKYMMQALSDKESIYKLLAILVCTALFLIVADIYNSWFVNKYKPYVEEHVQKDFYHRISNAAEKHEFEVYDNPSFYDDLTYINENIFKDSQNLLMYASQMLASLCNIILIINLFLEIGLGVLLISISAVVSTLVLEVPVVRFQNQRKYEVNKIDRKRVYFRNCFFDREFFGERKTTGISSLLFEKYRQSVNEQNSCERKYGVKLFLLSSLRELMSSNILMNLMLISYLLYEVLVTKALRGSDFIATYNAVNVVMNAILQIVMIWGQMSTCVYTFEKFQKFVSIDQCNNKCIRKDMGEVNSIEFRNVSFAYPGTDKKVLKNICLSIHSGEKIAIVGRNGSGKTTLVHLLMGLYYPTEGEILVNGNPLKIEEYPQYRKMFAAFFQGMKPIEATVAENIALDVDVDMERVRKVLQRTKCDDVFANPDCTKIGVQFDPNGLILSGGEYQKMLLAHCFYSDKSMLVMDEPSSMLDPIAEREFNKQILDLSGDKLTIFVTHRLSTVLMSDYIYVINDGILCDKGKHDELLKRDGVYKEMWNIQLEKYNFRGESRG